MESTSKSYSENYKILEDIHNKLQSGQNNPNVIDELAPMLEAASKSYQACKERIEAAEKFVAKFERDEKDG
ncbi:exodeoxyribonuclease VII small subunit [Fangia hongkongensis]|uniref:exodeoxyribonuclease VII small subunit n=1 Tax=Fangia hongkongensis TaxID=270495 RepID=UPI0003604292|nr:exodeoxyribonuclease VII small subunit [Fangia hongkongensis]MBK2124834.1 exodeoxyribonuclease VII small subunit [Fangia hongkongensis]